MPTLVGPVLLDAVWPLAKPHLIKAIELGGTHRASDVKHLLDRGQAQLWIEWGEREVRAAMVTEIVATPLKRWLRVWLAGGHIGLSAWRKFQAVVTPWAKAQGCTFMRIEGRKGWARALGWRTSAVIHEVDL